MNYKYLKSFQDFIFENDNYKGEHEAPMNADCTAPLHDITKIFPDDFYSGNALHLYGQGEDSDSEAIHIIQSAKNKPNKLIKIYRAVPDINREIDKKLKELYYITDYRNKYPFFPKNSIVDVLTHKYQNDFDSGKYTYNEVQDLILSDLYAKIDELQKDKLTPLKISDGNWVTITKHYAKEHGISNLNNKYKILTKTVPAKHLFTDGDIQEWGYDSTGK